jgi:hypothetical protein
VTYSYFVGCAVGLLFGLSYGGAVGYVFGLGTRLAVRLIDYVTTGRAHPRYRRI